MVESRFKSFKHTHTFVEKNSKQSCKTKMNTKSLLGFSEAFWPTFT